MTDVYTRDEHFEQLKNIIVEESTNQPRSISITTDMKGLDLDEITVLMNNKLKDYGITIIASDDVQYTGYARIDINYKGLKSQNTIGGTNEL